MGLFVTLEGPEGAGKSTQAQRLAARLERMGWPVRRVREPGGTWLGDRLRPILLSTAPSQVGERSEALLYSAARAQLVTEVIDPALRAGAVVVCDRYADSTLAYQGYGRGIPLDELRAILRFAVAERWPDLTFLLDLPVEEGLRRKRAGLAGGEGEWTRFEDESLAFHQRVRAGYQALAAGEGQRWVVLDARMAVTDLETAIWGFVKRRLPDASPGHPVW